MEDNMAKKLTKAEKQADAMKEWQTMKDKGWSDQRMIMEYFIGKTVKSIETTDDTITDAACVPRTGKVTTVTFTDGSGFTFAQGWPMPQYCFPEGVETPFRPKAAEALAVN